MTDPTHNPEPPPPGPIRLGKVHSLRAVRRALVRVTDAVLSGTLEPKVANCAIFGLSTITKVLEVEVLERRLECLERRAGVADFPIRQRSTGVVGHA